MSRYRWEGDGEFQDNFNDRVVAEGETVDIQDEIASGHKGFVPVGGDGDTDDAYTAEELAATDYEIRADNPAKGIQKNPEERRERYLSQAEIAAVSKALAEHPAQNAANAVRWLLLTGCRKSEALAMTWDQVDLQAGVWVKPSAHTKQKKAHRVPLSAPAVQLLHDIAKGQRTGEQYVFPGRKPGEPLKQLHTVWNAVKDKAGVQDVRLHDLRHTYASHAVMHGASLSVVAHNLGHTDTRMVERHYGHLAPSYIKQEIQAHALRLGEAETNVVSLSPSTKVK